MASARQLKHHARFHDAVLRYLFPPSPPRDSNRQESVNQSCKEVCFGALLPKGSELFAEEKCSVHEDGMEAGKAMLSRAQRKKQKLKKLKEQSDAMPAKRFIGPSLPDVIERKKEHLHNVQEDEFLSASNKHEVVDCESACVLLQDHGTPDKWLTLLNTENREHVHDVQEDEFLSASNNAHIAGETVSSCTKALKKDCHNGTEYALLSKAKRRRLAKKKFQDNLQRHFPEGSSFTAEIKDGDVVIKQMV